MMSSYIYAQKLPKIQKIGQRAPKDIKIDGATPEWNDQFVAYNSNNLIRYTVSNDDENLYLSLCAADGHANEKASFGITFSVILAKDKENSAKTFSVMYPTIVGVPKHEPIRNAIRSLRSIRTTKNSEVKQDSLRAVINKKMNDAFNELEVTGLPGMEKLLLPINNIEGLKVAAQLNTDMLYTYELAIPLKYLGASKNSTRGFKYNITLHGIPVKSPDGAFPPPIVRRDGEDFLRPEHAYILFPTDLSGQYILVK